MKHVFISYDHDDFEHCNELIQFLENHGYEQNANIWFDKYIGGSNDWRDEIEDAINDSFCLISIVTENSLKSPMCIYEWSYALGYGVPVIPIIFQNNLSFKDVHSPLSRQQSLPLSAELINFLNSIKDLKIEHRELSKKLLNAARPFRVMARLSLWMALLEDKLEACDKELVDEVVNYATDTALEIKNGDFLQIFLKYHSAMTKRQRRYARDLMNAAVGFWHKFWSQPYLLRSHYIRGEPNLNEIEKFRVEEVETAFQKFTDNHGTSADDYYMWFDKVLESIQNQQPLRQVPFMKLPLDILDSAIDDEELRKKVFICIATTYEARNGKFYGGVLF